MKKFISLVISVRKDLGILFLGCLVMVLIYEFILVSIPEIFTGAAKIGVISEKICLAYVTSFIFYFLVVHMKQQKDFENLYRIQAINIDGILGWGRGFVSEMSKASGVKLANRFPTESEMEKLWKPINPSAAVARQANWVEYFNKVARMNNHFIQKLKAITPFLDSELVKILIRIDEAHDFFPASDNLLTPGNRTIVLRGLIFRYLIKIERLDTYFKKKFTDYINNPAKYMSSRNL